LLFFYFQNVEHFGSAAIMVSRTGGRQEHRRWSRAAAVTDGSRGCQLVTVYSRKYSFNGL